MNINERVDELVKKIKRQNDGMNLVFVGILSFLKEIVNESKSIEEVRTCMKIMDKIIELQKQHLK